MPELLDILVFSPLNRSITSDGKTVRVQIYKDDGDAGWLLEVVDDHGNSSVWREPFASDQLALDEVQRTIDEEGIDSLIGEPSEAHQEEAVQSLSESELEELDEFLAGETIQETSMDVSTLDGFLTAIAIGPHVVRLSEWLPLVWDMDGGETEPEFSSDAEASHILSLIMRHYNSIVEIFNTEPTAFEPIFWRSDLWGAAEWCEGFITGFQFADEDWDRLADERPAWFEVFLRLGSDDAITTGISEEDAEKWMNEVEPSVLRLHTSWKAQASSQAASTGMDDLNFGRQPGSMSVARGGPKIGRNDPCPCGSGLKFKKCCGTTGASVTLH
jgi:uncharacterized protein